MGTNFYLMKKVKLSEGEIYHVGKRSAAGIYCWDCGVSLSADCIENVHSGKGFFEKEFEKVCPICNKKYLIEDWSKSSVGRELGFNKSLSKVKSGVASCSSFRWGLPEKWFHKKFEKSGTKKIIKNEYGDKFSYEEFMNILAECPIRLWHYDYDNSWA